MDRGNDYERAFEAYLHAHNLCCVAIDETRRSQFADAPIKSIDFIVHSPSGAKLLIDVKGRRYPTGSPGRERHVWECWSTADDISGLERWVTLFGAGYQGLLVFSYQLGEAVAVPEDTDDLWIWQGQRYLLRAVPVAGYREHMKVRSPRWGTVTLPRAAFRRLVRPLSFFTNAEQALV